MNILITNIDGNPQFIGGVKRVSSILGNEWIRHGHSVQFMTYLSGSDLRFDNIEGIAQSFLPNNKVIDCTENFDYFVQYVRENKIDIILHQFADSEELTRLCAKVKKETGVKLISTLHFSITHLNDIAKEMFFVKYRLGSNPINYLRDVLLWGNYWLRNRRKIAKENRRKLLNAYNLSDKVVVLSDKYIPIFEMEIGFIMKVAGIGLVVSVAGQILSKSGRDEQSTFVTIAGIIVVLVLLVGQMKELFTLIGTVFGLV